MCDGIRALSLSHTWQWLLTFTFEHSIHVELVELADRVDADSWAKKLQNAGLLQVRKPPDLSASSGSRWPRVMDGVGGQCGHRFVGQKIAKCRAVAS